MYYGTICWLVAKFRTKQQQFEDAATVNYNKTDAKYARPIYLLFIYLFIQYFQRVALLASIASLPSGPL